MKRKVGVAPAEWDDDKIRSWARAKHVARVYAQLGQQIAEIEERNVTEIPLDVQFHTATTLEDKVAVLGKARFGIGEGAIQIIRGTPVDEVLVDEEGAVDVAWCRVEGCDQGQDGGARFFDSESSRDDHEATHTPEQEADVLKDEAEAELVGV